MVFEPERRHLLSIVLESTNSRKKQSNTDIQLLNSEVVGKLDAVPVVCFAGFVWFGEKCFEILYYKVTEAPETSTAQGKASGSFASV